ncbi:MAG TPA: SUMF1/EgtB/PvdO family nonheme iron enzyme [Pseudolabrys sp.]|nr:SUMF1/EgtB/PvdO family nonheme iron enzyme [Pseudolabrys sp.]
MAMPILEMKFILAAGLIALLPATSQFPLAKRPGNTHPAPETVTIAPRDFSYRIAGDYVKNGIPTDGPLVHTRLTAPLIIMKAQVSAADFALCVSERACRPLPDRTAAADLPAVGVSWEDASAYAKWLSAKTGQVWRLPTDTEWAFAAGSRFADDAIDTTDVDDFSKRWIAKYEKEAARGRSADRTPQPIGTFGENENGLVDLSGNVWEWTDTCFTRQTLDASGAAGGELAGEPVVNCGVRVVEGQHRAYVSNFIRDARAGGCAVGAPPTNLGFRLVREVKPADLIASLLRRIGMRA